ncbi:putative mitogen-activated protein kinase 11 isoform X2 [Iris pallida]|uniref:Mitogen-activated protein kinase 11 isoform X2 n=1 Tax=Iris pallida TaxID=29817 RepID=A0AAX6EFE4_IRIPA|nr:putative mitogen-activated protein kinase 11 isoform X2 [Iris pallida]
MRAQTKNPPFHPLHLPSPLLPLPPPFSFPKPFINPNPNPKSIKFCPQTLTLNFVRKSIKFLPQRSVPKSATRRRRRRRRRRKVKSQAAARAALRRSRASSSPRRCAHTMPAPLLRHLQLSSLHGGENVVGINGKPIAQKLRGRVGTTVTVKLYSGTVDFHVFMNNIFFIHPLTTASEMESTIQAMENQGVQSYILDLRNNPISLTESCVGCFTSIV